MNATKPRSDFSYFSNPQRQRFSRRALLRRFGGTAAGMAGSWALGKNLLVPSTRAAETQEELYCVKNKRIRQSVVHWCFSPMPAEELAAGAARLGIGSVELVAPEHWPALKQRGLICAMAPSHGFTKGFAHREEHAECLQVLRERIGQCAAAGFPSVITFSGFRRGLSDEQGWKNMADGLKQIAGYAEQKKINVCLEVLNSRVNVEMKGHPDYFADHLEPAVELCRRIGSERIKLLFDIYHIQIMEGDIISRIKQFHPCIAHYHTAGNPGRNEIDESQELSYPAIMRAIIETGYRGWVGQEFIPTRDKLASLSQGVKICDV